jgi:Uma2 family endonuclease
LKSPYRAYVSDLKVRVSPANAYYYSDVVVTCEDQDSDPYVVHEPLIVGEVLSPTTEKVDRREKARNYKTMLSVREILLVSQEERQVELHRRHGEDWIIETIRDEGPVELPSISAAFQLDTIYENIFVAH